MNIPWEEFWWQNVTGPHALVTSVSSALQENRSVVLQVPPDLPWRHSMRSAIQQDLRSRIDNSDVVLESIDNVDDNPDHLLPGRFLLNRFAPSAVSKGYREKGKTTIQAYLSAYRVLKNRIIWINGLDRDSANQWIQFCHQFPSHTVRDGLFVLEVPETLPAFSASNLRFIPFSDCISSYDVQLFNLVILGEDRSLTSVWKGYIASLLANVCDVDAEVSCQLLHGMDFRTTSIWDGLQELAALPEFSRRGRDKSSKHIFHSCRSGRQDVISYRVWKTQLQTVFPIIEMGRIRLIETWSKEIQHLLDKREILQYDEPITDLMDVELGTLFYLLQSNQLCLPDNSVRERVQFLRTCRNKLAHSTCCSLQEIALLLD